MRTSSITMPIALRLFFMVLGAAGLIWAVMGFVMLAKDPHPFDLMMDSMVVMVALLVGFLGATVIWFGWTGGGS